MLISKKNRNVQTLCGKGFLRPPTLYADERRENPFTDVFFPGAAVKQLGYTTQLIFYNSLFVDISSQFIISKS